MRYLLTPSLHNSWEWFNKADFKKESDFMDTLNKVFVQSEPMKLGIKFEDDIQAYVNGELTLGDDLTARESCIQEIGDIVRGCTWQDRLSKEIEICGMTFLLYGKADCIKRDWIYDIKRTASFDFGKYRNSIQHLTYMYLSEKEKFAYLASDEKSVWREDYFWSDESESQLFGMLTEMVEGIMNHAPFKEAFLNNWKCKY